jgi:hypothetical protein
VGPVPKIIERDVKRRDVIDAWLKLVDLFPSARVTEAFFDWWCDEMSFFEPDIVSATLREVIRTVTRTDVIPAIATFREIALRLSSKKSADAESIRRRNEDLRLRQSMAANDEDDSGIIHLRLIKDVLEGHITRREFLQRQEEITDDPAMLKYIEQQRARYMAEGSLDKLFSIGGASDSRPRQVSTR